MTKEEFWNWFDNNKAALENLLTEKTNDYEVYDALSEKLKKHNVFLIPEITINEDKKFILVASCDGMKQGMPFVELLTEGLRKFEDWAIVKFRQPGTMEIIPINGVTLKRSSIFLEWKSLRHKNI